MIKRSVRHFFIPLFLFLQAINLYGETTHNWEDSLDVYLSVKESGKEEIDRLVTGLHGAIKLLKVK